MSDIIYEELEPLIRLVGKGKLKLKSKQEIIYTISRPIKDVKCSLQGEVDLNGNPLSEIQCHFDGIGDDYTPYMMEYENISILSIKNISFNLMNRGRGSISVSLGKYLVVGNCEFSNYSLKFGHYKTDSNLLFVSCTSVLIKNNYFHDNEGQSNEDRQLNRCISIHDRDRKNPISNGFFIKNNRFIRVNQGIVIQSNSMSICQCNNNYFENLVDNALYLLYIEKIEIRWNQFKDLFDEAIVISGYLKEGKTKGTFDIQHNQATNIKVKFLGIDGSLEQIFFCNNKITNRYEYPEQKNRPAVIAWRNNALESTVDFFVVENNQFDLDTSPANYDVFPFGRTTVLLFRKNSITIEKLSRYQKLFALEDKEKRKIEYVEFSDNVINSRKEGEISLDSQFLREMYPLTPINHLVIKDFLFVGTFPNVQPYKTW
ncbi:hypothetical protein [Carnobacterium divergens]|uniref:Right handed beta helix domain-containing protein n=2 Tax=Carnobacterium divergens TaxID=2748 RepID=A0A0R2HWD7_CARDV|nr:hypothetical protein [Carnobacterium divergens]KRN57027.1 hypothetical protein IV74_GL000677 [Carnobacterium divergens DSM 20623]MDO0874750.1 hypothetical protein [Carnobacterium divergens]MDT1959489.1 hypothetical protein [Carnobacterium divergens]MDT1975456.1 hypothetical protein [Carnobacterium divergens]SUX16132.1 Uncharacterised protein [Carnobacterium divergens]